MSAVPPVTGSLLVSCLYDSTGKEWCMMFDNAVLAWQIDATGAVPPQPVIVGTPAPEPPDTSPIVSPAWVVREGGPTGVFFAPDIARGTAHEMFSALATNNGARRPLYANFADTSLIQSFAEWSGAHPDLVLSEPPQ